MSRMEILRKEVEKSYFTEAWYPPLQPVLEGLTAAQASWRPPGEAANTIWEYVNHLLYYQERFLERIKGGSPAYPASTNDDTFTVEAPDDEAAWQATVKRVEEVYQGLRDVLATLPEEAYDRPLSGGSLGETLLNLLTHAAYHTGQIVQIRKMQGSWPARRSFD
ncbi:DinB family protein [Brevibacillus sp. SYP-B805]|uniref:DinB family protein n=1 Tax=Brevibacillus sp. SYP-B805 TaxID=1578199 RepID=UPI0013ED644E|nr:DinB family protein [Brevibacillus sp. SYP-B805]NGQ94950.1 DinB family protein [Brevibacillus sp. SYP-B805]